jgi:hypothetical protein
MSQRMRIRFLIVGLFVAVFTLAVSTVILVGSLAAEPSWLLGAVAGVWLVSICTIIDIRLTIAARRLSNNTTAR